MNSQLNAHKSVPSPQPKSRWRIKILGIAGLLLLLFVLTLPTIVGSRWVYEPLLKRLALEKFSLSIDSVKLRWFSPLEFEGIAIKQSDDANAIHPLVTIRSIKTNRSLFGYLLNGRNIGRVEVIEPRLDIALLEDGSNLERMLKAVREVRGDDKPAPTRENPKFDLDVVVRGLSVQIMPNDGGGAIAIIPPMNAELSYRALEEDPILIVQPMQVLDQVDLTPQLVRLGVGLAVPLLAKSAWIDGRVSMSTQEIRVPLSKPVQSVGEATLTLHQVRSGPSEPLIVGALDALARLRGKEASHELVFVDGSQVMIRVAEERIFHTGLKAGLPRLDPRLQIASEGYVGLVDRSLELSLEIPIPLEQLARREKIQQLGVPRVRLPIGGTLDDPEVQWNTMRGESAMLLSLMAGQLQNDAPIASAIVDAIGSVTEGQADEAIASAVDFVKQLRQRRAEENAKREAEGPKDETPSTPPQRRRPLRDAFKKAMGDN